MRVVVGVDSSTQSTKVEARDIETGAVVGRGSAPHPPVTPPQSEQDPNAWWDALTAALAQLGDVRSDVVGMAVAGQQHGLVLVDDAGDAVRPAKLWNDTTSAPQAAELAETLGVDRWATACGSVPVAAFTITKLAWMAAHEPAALDRVAKILLPHDYLTWRLTGQHVTDRGDASGTGWFDPVANRYVPELLDAAIAGGSDMVDRLPRLAAFDQPVGTINADAADRLGLPGDLQIGVGTGDNMAAAMGLGLAPGDVAISLGTSGTVYSVSATPTADVSGHVAGFADALGGYLPLVCTLNATKVTDTVARWMRTDAAGLSELALAAEPGAGDVVLVPYFDGERTPNLPDATGSFFGLRTTTTPEEMARAAHDGVLCGLLDGLDALRTQGVDADGRVFLTGGGARSAAYQQRCADLLGRPIVVPDADETVATGVALQAAAIVDARPALEISAAWGLGAGAEIEPRADDGQDVRAAYTKALEPAVGDGGE